MIVVVGAGPAGLSAAHHLEREYVLLERAEEVGGLCRSFTLAGCTFDLGGHAFFTSHDDVRQLITQTCDAGLYRQPRAAWVFAHDTYVPYPFQSNLYGLPIDVVKECLVSAVEQRAASPAPAATLADWIATAFGAGVAHHFLRPYNEKLWAHPLSDIVPTWTAERVVQPPIADMIEGALRRRAYLDVPNAEVAYPAHGGFIELFRGLERSVTPNLRRGTVDRIDLDARIVGTVEGDEFPFDELVSTMPLTDLVRATHPISDQSVALAAQLACNSLFLVNLVVDRPAITDMHRVYVADPSIPFHKLVLNSNSSPALRDGPHFGIQAEISYSEHKPLVEEGLVDAVIDSVRRIGVLAANDRIVETSTIRVPRAYPVYTKEWEHSVAELRTWYARHGVHLLGRFGEWAYINSDEAVHRGRELARKLNGNRQPTVARPAT